MTPPREPLPYYRWYWRDWRASRSVQRMPFEARAIYRELLDECWSAGSFADNLAKVADICGATLDIVTTAWPHIRPHFYKKGRRLYNERIEHLRKEAAELRETKSLAGKLSAEKRRQQQSTRLQQLLTPVEHDPTSSSSAVHIQSSSSAARSAARRTRPSAAALGVETPSGTAPLRRLGDVDWRADFAARGVTPPAVPVDRAEGES